MKSLLILLALFITQSCSSLFYQPSPKHFVDPRQFKLDYEDVWFSSSDGTKLHGWFFKARTDKPKGTIIQFHGNAQNMSTHFFSLIWMIEHGYNLFTFDYRGYAKSEGKPSQRGIYEDSLAALDRAFEYHQKSGAGKFVVYGQSLGGAISLRSVPDWKHYEKIALLIMDSTFSSYKDIAFDKLTDHWFLMPISPLAYVLVSDEYGPFKVFEKIRGPTLVIAGLKDRAVPPKFGIEIYENIKAEPKWLWEIKEGSHIDAYHHKDGMIYREKLVDLLESLKP